MVQLSKCLDLPLLLLQGTPQTELPPAELDLGHQVIESQQYAIAQPGMCYVLPQSCVFGCLLAEQYRAAIVCLYSLQDKIMQHLGISC